ncbi:hypothetical protein BDZ45DRAFT_670913 [Acephala macrosclerotiorum]|nr:hypothetical protein BDZ45DRAFT_670913 [Acephala macrosclerotiorum]
MTFGLITRLPKDYAIYSVGTTVLHLVGARNRLERLFNTKRSSPQAVEKNTVLFSKYWRTRKIRL